MEAMVGTVDDVEALLGPIKERLTKALELRDEGYSYSDIGSRLEGSPVIEMLGVAIDLLIDATARLRRAAARELHDEGLTMDQIAALFGVTRQRISGLLREGKAK